MNDNECCEKEQKRQKEFVKMLSCGCHERNGCQSARTLHGMGLFLSSGMYGIVATSLLYFDCVFAIRNPNPDLIRLSHSCDVGECGKFRDRERMREKQRERKEERKETGV